MELFRITQENYAEDLSGNGAKIFGGRWNNEGKYALYTSTSRSLALLETLAHTPAKMLSSKDYILITLHIPDNTAREKISSDKLLSGWDTTDAGFYTKKIGDQFLIENKKLLLEVPSVVLPEEMNVVLNPEHVEMKKVKLIHKRRIIFDSRIQINSGL